jgi:hypothetical protein
MSERRVRLITAPISERYWNTNDIYVVRDNKIRLGGCWFNFDERYEYVEVGFY